MTATRELEILKVNLPKGDIEEKFVNEYHAILTAEQNRTGENLREYFIPPSELKKSLISQRFDDYGELIEASYSSVRYCDRNLFTFKIDKAMTHLNERYKPADSLASATNTLSLSDIKPDVNQGGLQHAGQLYEQVNKLYQSTKSLDEETARVIVELADDAIKEFGTTNQNKKAELKQWKAKAELILPPVTVEELKKRAEGKLLQKTYPRKRNLRNLLLITICLIMFGTPLVYLFFTYLFKSSNTEIHNQNAEPTQQAIAVASPPTSTVISKTDDLKATRINPSLVNNTLRLELVLVNSGTGQVLLNDLYPMIYRGREQVDPSDTRQEEPVPSDTSGTAIVIGSRPSIKLENVKVTQAFPVIVKQGEILPLTITASFDPAKYYYLGDVPKDQGLKSIGFEVFRKIQIGLYCSSVDSTGSIHNTENTVIYMDVTKSGNQRYTYKHGPVNLFQGQLSQVVMSSEPMTLKAKRP